MNRGKNIAVGFYGLWTCLGAYRGHQYYNKEYQEKLERHNKYYKNERPEPKHYYTVNVGFAAAGAAFYANPLLVPITMVKELFYLEDYLRDRDTD